MPTPEKKKVILLDDCCVAGGKHKKGEVVEVSANDRIQLVGMNLAEDAEGVTQKAPAEEKPKRGRPPKKTEARD